MKYLLSSFFLFALVLFAGCEKDESVSAPLAEPSYEAFYLGYGGGWGTDVWYRITTEVIDKYDHRLGDELPEVGYANPDNWITVTNTSHIAELRELETNFPDAVFADLEQSFCPEVAVDGNCLRVGFGSLTPDNATIWFRNSADNPIAVAYLESVSSVLYEN